MNICKRLLASVLALCVALGVSACGEEKIDGGSLPQPSVSAEASAVQESSGEELEAAVDAVLEESALETYSVLEETERGNLEKLQQMVSGYAVDLDALTFNCNAWQYDAEHDVYYQYGVGYCAVPEALDYETLGIYVPGAYLEGTINADGTYTCTPSVSGQINGYTAKTAPVVHARSNTAGYSAQAAPTGYNYSSLESYLEAGFVYVYAGCRGRNNGYYDDGSLAYNGGAPWGVTDLKAAVRYLRFNDEQIPGDAERIFTFGHSGGGAQSAVVGASGDSPLYFDYLASIGAAMYDAEGNYISDAICGAMCWCPITSLDYADAAYEWNMGQYMDSGTRGGDTWTSALSLDLAEAYGAYINELGLVDKNGNVLTLEETEDGVYTSGSYYDYLLEEIERSLNHFLSDTEFPYTSGSSFMADGGFGGPMGASPGGAPPDGGLPMDLSDGSESITYETPEAYIDSLNQDETWVTYDADTNTVSVSSVAAFARTVKNATKSVAAFDDLSRSQAENYVFGDGNADALHFDAALTELLVEHQTDYEAYADFDGAYVTAYQEYRDSVDALGKDSIYRQNMYNPMYYLVDFYEGADSSTVAKHWRVHSGIAQGDTALTVEMNLALALEQCDDVSDVDFEMVWGQGHTMAERTGNGETNFIAWVQGCCR